MTPRWLLVTCVLASALARAASVSSGGADCILRFDQLSYNVNEGETVDVVVSLETTGNLGDTEVVVMLTSTDGTAVAGTDYQDVSQTLTFTNTTRDIAVTVSANLDGVVDGEESFTLSLTQEAVMSGVMLPDGPVTVIITDRTVRAMFVGGDRTVQEGDMPLQVTVMVEADNLDRQVTVNIIATDDTTESGDYTVNPMTLTFSSDTTSHMVTITAESDNILENEEMFSLSMTADPADNVEVANMTEITITDATMASIRFASTALMVVEGGQVEFQVVVNGTTTIAPGRIVMATVRPMATDSAEAVTDFPSEDVTVELGSTGSVNGTIMIGPDDVIESDETFELMLATEDPSVTVMGGPATVAITDNTPLVLQFDRPSYTVAEGRTEMVVVSTPTTLDREVLVTIQSPENTDGDFTVAPATLTFTPTNSSATVTITAEVDYLDEPEQEDFDLILMSPDDTSLDFTPSTLIINDTTVNVEVTLDTSTLREGGPGTNLNFTATEPVTENIVIIFTTEPGDQIMIMPMTVTLTSTNTTASVRVFADADDVIEGMQIVMINITSVANAAFIDQIVTVEDTTVLLREGPQPQQVVAMEDITFTCKFDASFQPTIVWTRDGDMLPLGQSETTGPTADAPGLDAVTYTSVLSVNSVGFDDCGVYNCSVMEMEDLSATANLEVVELTNTSDTSPTFSVGSVANLSCTIRRCGSFSINWFINEDEATVSPPPVNVINTPVDGQPNVMDTFSEVTINTVGEYNNGSSQSCSVLHPEETDPIIEQYFNFTLDNVNVTISVSPDPRPDGNYVQGDTVVLMCNATNPPGVNRTLIFRFIHENDDRGVDLVDEPNAVDGITVATGDDYVTLTLTDIRDRSDQEASYLCQVYNRLVHDSAEDRVVIDIISGPELRFPKTGEPDAIVNLGDDLVIECDGSQSEPKVDTIVIRADGVELDSTTENSLTVTIDQPQLNDTGTLYECFSNNSIGNTTVGFNLTVRDAPDAVDNETIIPESLSLVVARITWIAPADNNAEITGYKLTLVQEPAGEPEVVETTETAVNVYLAPTQTYTVTVTASNVVGPRTSHMTTVRGIMTGAEPTITHTQLAPDLIQFEWTLSEYVTNVSDVMDSASRGDIIVNGYNIVPNGGASVTVDDETNYLYRVVEDDIVVFFTVNVDYNDPSINSLTTDREVRVTVEDVIMVPPANMEPADEVTRPTGFTIEWNEPELLTDLTDQSLLTGYNIIIRQLGDGDGVRRRRQSGVTEVVNRNLTATETSFNFVGGEPFTEYSVTVDGLVESNGVTGRVVALAEYEIETEEAQSSPPQNFRNTTFDVTSVELMWDVPEDPNGRISLYELVISPRPSGLISPISTSGLSAVVTGLTGHTPHTATVLAVNGAGEGMSATLPFMTNFGVSQPSIGSVTTNQDTRMYLVRINRFSTNFGPLSHYAVYTVVQNELGDTTDIDESAENVYITRAGPATEPPFTVSVGGEGTMEEYTAANVRVSYENRPIRRGQNYYFFVRLYSSVDQRIFNDSDPQKPLSIIPSPEDEGNVVAIIGACLGVLAFILILILIGLIIFACKGRVMGKFDVPHLRRLEDGEKGGIELRRRTRHFTPVLDVGDPNVFTSVTQPTTLVCEVSGTPAPTISWTHEGKPVDDERCLVLADHSLFIQNTRIEDEGSYLVTAENSTGTSSAQIKVTVIKPTPPDHDEGHPPVSVDSFTEYYARMKANDGDDLDEEYQDVEPEFAHTSYAAKLSINRNKNRYINIIPYDHSRVVLALQENTPGSDYINASFIDGHKRSNQYIASQGPTTTTLADFWRMVWELDCPTIVMVTKLEEEDKRKCEQYWPSYGSTTYGNVQVTLKEAENLAEYSIRTFSVSPLAGQSSAQMPVREVKQFHFLKWPDHGVPNYATALLHFRKRVHLYHPTKRGPMIVHCSAGVGRTGTFITVDYCLERMEGEGSVDIFNYVQQMRFKRNYMVQTSSQYEFIHEAIHEAITCGDTSVKAPELKEWLSKLTPDPETGKTLLDEQFKRLESASPQDEEFDCTVAEVNKEKNRMTKHLPANDQRVVLSSEDDMCDYICASYVDGYRQRNAFMITQGPMENTVGDFWRMVWELKSAAIVMLTQLEENEEEMSRKYWSDTVGEAAVFGQFHVELTSEVRDLGDYCTRKIKLSPISKPQESRIVTQFHFTKWTQTTPPESAKPMIDMIDELQRVQRKSGNQPITVHCNDGLGRTGTFCTLYYVLDRVKTEQVVDVFQAVKTLRIQRTGLVANLEQFRFVHTATMEFLNTFSDYQNFK